MNFFGPSYDKNLEVSCVPLNKNGQIKQVGDNVKYIEKEYVTSVLNKEKTTRSKTVYNYYVLTKDINKIKNGTLQNLNVSYIDSNDYSVTYDLLTQGGKVISGISNSMGCTHRTIFFIIDGVSMGGLRRRNKRVTKRKRKMTRRSHHKKSRKSHK